MQGKLGLGTRRTIRRTVMPAPKPSITRSEFDALVRKSGLPLSEEQRAECFAAYGYVEAMAERVRANGHRPREAEPALTFKPAEK
jgi:hypothetical protein